MDRLIQRIDEIAKIGVTEHGICRRSGSEEDHLKTSYRWLYVRCWYDSPS